MLAFKKWLKAKEEDEPPKAWWRYGHYCGPGPRLNRPACNLLASGKPLPNPINAIDAACQQHDLEYCHCGVGWEAGMIGGKTTPCSLQSDEKLIDRLDSLKDLSLGQKLAAGAIKRYFGLHLKTQGNNRGNNQ